MDSSAAGFSSDDPVAAVDALTNALVTDARLTAVSGVPRYAAAPRLARFHTSNEFGDWITVLQTVTYCNALHAALTGAPSVELARGIFNGAGKLYLDRFLKLPAARLPDERAPAAPGHGAAGRGAPELLRDLADLCDREQQVDRAARLAHVNVAIGGAPEALPRTLGHLLLGEDSEFPAYQELQADFATYQALAPRGAPCRGTGAGRGREVPCRPCAGITRNVADRTERAPLAGGRGLVDRAGGRVARA